ETALPAEDVAHHKKAACLYAKDLLHHQAAEVARSIQFSCIVFSARDHRTNEGLLSLDHLKDNISGDLRKRINDCAGAHFISLIRLLLFPNHYFW
ncbi:MAG TPA: hypothetical protein VM187_11555, partial [Niastella sp.]|nr:hypothetical protein [Niastella sp.]